MASPGHKCGGTEGRGAEPLAEQRSPPPTWGGIGRGIDERSGGGVDERWASRSGPEQGPREEEGGFPGPQVGEEQGTGRDLEEARDHHRVGELERGLPERETEDHGVGDEGRQTVDDRDMSAEGKAVPEPRREEPVEDRAAQG